MSREARVLLRPLTRSERATLTAKLRQGSLPALLHRRYRVIALVRSGCSAREAAARADWHNQNVYHWLHAFNKSGFASFERASNPRGRVPIISAKQLQDLVDTALSSPEKLGLPFTSWTVRTLGEYCRKKKLIPAFSDEWVRLLLRRSGLTSQRIRTWKHSNDPKFGPKDGASAPSSAAVRRARRS